MDNIEPDDCFPQATSAPAGSVIIINSKLIEKAIEESRRTPRRRVIMPFHKSPDDHLQRMLNALQLNSYIQPHRHKESPKAESIIVLKGAIGYITFKEGGEVERCFTLKAGSTEIGIDTEPHVFHTFFAIEEDTILFEVKPGPYNPDTDKDFATWAPAEGSKEAEEYLEKLCKLIET